MEAVFGAVGGWLILGEKLTSRELAGCIIMLLAIIISQLPNKIKYLGRSLS
jgi:drug/metabolite transporter (DMT)-like permease